jgi:MbtH protein
MSNNPFDDPNGTYLVLVNVENQHSLWPHFADVPPGWIVTFGPAPRQTCVDHISANWADLRPASLAAQLDVA